MSGSLKQVSGQFCPPQVFVPLSFFLQGLCLVNARTMEGGAFALQAATLTREGSLSRSKEFLLFAHGFLSLAVYPAEVLRNIPNTIGYLCNLATRSSRKKVAFWYIGNPQLVTVENRTFLLEGGKPELCHLDRKPTGEHRLLFGLEGSPGQFFFIGPNTDGYSACLFREGLLRRISP